MPGTTYYIQECPTCSRVLQVRVAYLGKAIVCQHCGSEFAASDPSCSPVEASTSGVGLLQRAEELLASADREKVHPR